MIWNHKKGGWDKKTTDIARTKEQNHKLVVAYLKRVKSSVDRFLKTRITHKNIPRERTLDTLQVSIKHMTINVIGNDPVVKAAQQEGHGNLSGWKSRVRSKIRTLELLRQTGKRDDDLEELISTLKALHKVL